MNTYKIYMSQWDAGATAIVHKLVGEVKADTFSVKKEVAYFYKKISAPAPLLEILAKNFAPPKIQPEALEIAELAYNNLELIATYRFWDSIVKSD